MHGLSTYRNLAKARNDTCEELKEDFSMLATQGENQKKEVTRLNGIIVSLDGGRTGPVAVGTKSIRTQLPEWIARILKQHSVMPTA
jgi:hypothetical protein